MKLMITERFGLLGMSRHSHTTLPSNAPPQPPRDPPPRTHGRRSAPACAGSEPASQTCRWIGEALTYLLLLCRYCGTNAPEFLFQSIHLASSCGQGFEHFLEFGVVHSHINEQRMCPNFASEGIIDVSPQAVGTGQVAADAGLQVAFCTPGVGVEASGESEAPEPADGDGLGAGDADQ